ncbi:MAG: peptidoglycan recognition family protein [Tissierellia bacterium]|nr:peptidoglycan recognition family protein [Tissierellia bacterium]
MNLRKKLVKRNYASRKGSSIRYIVIHDTGNPSPGADAMAHYHYFNNAYRGASAHYFVDEKGILEIIEQANSAWHCGDGRGKYGITNANSIGIELCINKGNNMEKTYEYAKILIRELMERYGLSKTRVVRHYDASRKICPGHMSQNNWGKWWGFWESI